MMKTKAIIADDEAPLRSYLKSLLVEAWPELIICGDAQNGQEALELIERHRPQIAFLDIRMPEVNGFDVLKVIRKQHPRTFVIISTALDLEDMPTGVIAESLVEKHHILPIYQHDTKLYVSVADGTLFRLDRSGQSWEKAGSGTPRLAHRLASKGETVLVIGGAADGNNYDLIEAVPVGRGN